MKVNELKKILENLDDDSLVQLEYMPCAHEYVIESIQGARVECGKVIFFGTEA